MATAIGTWLRDRRAELDLSLAQVQLRTRGSVESSHLSKVERGLLRATPEVLMALAPVYKAELTFLYALAGLWPEGASVSEPEPVAEVDAVSGITRGIAAASNLNDVQKRRLTQLVRPIVAALVEQIEREEREHPASRDRRKRTRAG